MPWCHQCGAEYREGVTECATCRAALTAEPPPRSATPWRDSLPPALRRILDYFTRPAGYAAEAWRVLRRHPALLLLPVALAVFGAMEHGAARYVTFRYTTVGRKELAFESSRPWSQRPAPIFVPNLLPLAGAVNRMSFPVPGALLSGTLESAGFVVTPHVPGALGRLLPIVPALLLSLLLEAGVLAGYYQVIGQATREDVVAWPLFWDSLRRHVLGFWLFGILMTALWVGPHLLALLLDSLGVPAPAHAVVRFAAWAVAFLLSLTLVAIAADDASLLGALRRGAAVVLRDLPVALLLLAGWIVMLAALNVLGYLAAITVGAHLRSLDIAVQQLASIPGTALKNSLLAAAGTWFLLVAFLWYRGRRAAPALAAALSGGGEVSSSGTPVAG